MVKNAWDYKLSSAVYHIGKALSDILIDDSDLLREVNDWKAHLSENDNELEEIRLTTRTGRPFGRHTFVKTAEKRAKRV